MGRRFSSRAPPDSSVRTSVSASSRRERTSSGVDCFTDYYDPALKRRNIARLLRSDRIPHCSRRTCGPHPLEPLLAGRRHGLPPGGAGGCALLLGTGVLTSTPRTTSTRRSGCSRPAGRRGGSQRFVYASSSSVYGDAPRYPTAEDEPKLPISPYGVTKLAAELLVRLYALHYGLPARVAALLHRLRSAAAARHGIPPLPPARSSAARTDHRLRRRRADARLHLRRRRRRGERPRAGGRGRAGDGLQHRGRIARQRSAR